jgi:hypothetical protein
MVAIDTASSVPPHIQPPIAHVPRPIRDTVSGLPGIGMVSKGRLLLFGRFEEAEA